MLRISETDISLPEDWMKADHQLARRLSEGFADAVPGGLPASARRRVLDSLRDLVSFVERVAKDGTFVSFDKLREKTLQQELKKHLLSREVPVREGEEVGGGESDLVLYNEVIVENKVRGATADPFETGDDYSYQARRYSISLLQRVSFVVVAYQPSTEGAILPVTGSINVGRMAGAPEGHAAVRVVIPWGAGVPSSARAPRQSPKPERGK